MGDYAKAEPLCRQAIEITKAALGEKHPEYAASLYRPGQFIHFDGGLLEGRAALSSGDRNHEAGTRENHPDYARTMSNLAMMYESMGRYAEAEPLQKKSIEILPVPVWI